MRIIYIFNGFTWGGAEKLVYDLARNMIKKAEFVGVVGLYRYGDHIEHAMQEELHACGVHTMILDCCTKQNLPHSIREIYQFAKEQRVDVIHGHCSIPMQFAKAVGLLLNISVICTIHSVAGYSKWIERMTSWKVHVYVAIGESAGGYMRKELHIPERKIIAIHNAIETDVFASGKRRPDFWEPYGEKQGDEVLINVARVCDVKNQMCILRALKRCISHKYENVKLYILGSYRKTDAAYQTLKHYIKENQLEKHVTFLGMHRWVVDFLANADCFVMTSRYEGLSLAFLEAVMAGLPIICTDMPFVQELNAISDCATVVPQDDDEALAGVLERRAYKRQSQETIRKFSEMFAMEPFVEQHYHLYERSLRKRKD